MPSLQGWLFSTIERIKNVYSCQQQSGADYLQI